MDSGLRVVGRLGFRVEGRNVPKVRSLARGFIVYYGFYVFGDLGGRYITKRRVTSMKTVALYNPN